MKINITLFNDKDWNITVIAIILNTIKDYNNKNNKYIKSMKKILSVVSICSAVGATLLLFCDSLETTIVSIGLMWNAIVSTKELAEYGRSWRFYAGSVIRWGYPVWQWLCSRRTATGVMGRIVMIIE